MKMILSKPFIDKLAFTYPVVGDARRRIVWQLIKKFQHELLVEKKHFTRKGRQPYHDRYQYTFAQADGHSIISLSINPVFPDTNFIQCEFSPDHFGGEGMRMLRDEVLTRILGKSEILRLFCDARVTRVDFTIDLYQLAEFVHLYNAARNAKHSKIKPVRQGSGWPTEILGAPGSRRRTTWYDKTAERRARAGAVALDNRHVRLEQRLRLGMTPCQVLNHRWKPYADLRFYRGAVLEDPALPAAFTDLARQHGITHALAEVGPGKNGYLATMEPYRVSLLDGIDGVERWAAAMKILTIFRPSHRTCCC